MDSQPQPRMVGQCISCYLGKHEKCLDAVAILGCGCVCNLEFDDL